MQTQCLKHVPSSINTGQSLKRQRARSLTTHSERQQQNRLSISAQHLDTQTLRAQETTPEAFAPFGQVLSLLRPHFVTHVIQVPVKTAPRS